ncbi:bifunctional hydroxymethylpyrimidine kinase/phosphomethylpyrimidine kinase [Psychromicrobium sp. YIM B11713]|uniref:bifunctional hydroxymethylpyrimidine kinase/phosphomethylpyrimidine kinase n=1 Tax=Psychromicrobium sp. YIM B11713 TaxID=3145233 RepID=UPI00374F3570
MSGSSQRLRQLSTPPSGIPRVLSIAGTDPSGGAGIQADLKSIAAQGGYGMAVVTALVAQNTQGVSAVHVPPVSFLAEQLTAVSDDVEIDAVKIGMLANREVIKTVADWLARHRPAIVVLDPVMVATSGDRLLDEDAENALRELLSTVDLVTPNLPELAILAEEAPAVNWPEALAQAARLANRYGVTVLAKGGHLAGEQAPDALIEPSRGEEVRVTQFPARRIRTENTHGTGCSLSAGLATRRAAGEDWPSSLREVKRWLSESIAHGAELRVGKGRGPINHFAGLWQRGGLATSANPEDLKQEWWQDISAWRAAIDELPFIRKLADGSLEPASFRWYLAQDALYLREYSRGLAEASKLAPSTAEQAFWAASAQNAIATELGLHRDWLGAETVFEQEPSQTTTHYLQHLHACRDSYPLLIAALLPCFWLYHDVGSRLQHAVTEQHPYRSWLETYADPEFTEATRRAIDFVMTAAVQAGPAERSAMQRAFRISAEHERDFFAAPLLRCSAEALSGYSQLNPHLEAETRM